MTARLRSPLVLILLAGLATTVVYVLQIKQYFVQPDELEYVEQALRIGQQWHPVTSGDRAFTSWSQLQPVLMAPAFRLLSANGAFVVQHIINSVVMVSAAIPAYLLTLRVEGSRRAAALVSALTIAVPWVAMSATMLTEVPAYPAFLWAVLAIHVAVVAPSGRKDVLALAAIGLAVAARPQLAVLAPVFLITTLTQELRRPGRAHPLERHGVLDRARTLLRSHPVLLGVTLLAVIAAALAGLVSSRTGVLGSYATATDGSLLPKGTWATGREALAYVAFAVGVLPLSLGVALVLREGGRPSTPQRHAFAVLLALCTLGLMLAVGSFSVRFTGGINSRYVFYLAPLLFVASVSVLRERQPSTVALLAGGALATWLVASAQLTLRGPSLVSPDSAFHDVLFGRAGQLEDQLALRDIPAPRLLAFLALGAIAAAALGRARGRRREVALVLAGLISAWVVVETGYTLIKVARTQAGVSPAFISGRSWIDHALPEGATAPMLISSLGTDPASAAAAWWDTEFWNKKVNRVLQLGGEDTLTQAFPDFLGVTATGGLLAAETALYGRPGTGLGTTGWLVRSQLDARFGIVGLRVVGARNGVQLVRIPVPTQLRWWLRAPVDTGAFAAGSSGTLNVYGTPGEHTVRLTVSALAGAASRRSVRIYGPGVQTARVVALGRPLRLRLRVTIPPRAAAVLRIRSGGSPAPAGTTSGVQVSGVAVA